MNITRHNCESFFLDYYEKILSPVEVAEVLFFLEENPDLKEVFEEYEAVFLEYEKVNFPDRESLKKKYNREELDLILSSEINKTNCEQFFVASIEGLLSETQNQRLNLFLIQYPELVKEFELFQKCKLSAEHVSFRDKSLLKKETINAQNKDEYFIRAIDGDLNPEEEKQLTSFLQRNPEFKKEFAEFKKTILELEKITFEFKSQLKKKERQPAFVYIFSQQRAYYAAAAAVLLLAGLFLFFDNNNKGVYFADKNNSFNSKSINAKSPQTGNIASENGQIITAQEIIQAQTKNIHEKKQEAVSVNKASIVKPVQTEEEKNSIQAAPSQDNTLNILIAKKAEEKKIEPEPVQNAIASNNMESKKDSTVDLPVGIQGETVAGIVAAPKKEEYQTVASLVNKKVRSILGIKNATECETSAKITLWDLAMVAKNGVQRIVGTKTLDVNKVCEGSGEKVEYFFAAGNFEISKSVSK